ncbi:MAG: MBL fold metallo-hydrolase [Herpetosiphonaceae bacterium]|nr:MBL fold metallo-hydrolase [Herpetosiphonaceae bacterium]
MAVPITHIADHIAMIDNGLLQTDGFGATYVVRGDQVAIIETGTSLSAAAILSGLDQLGIARDAVAHILLTHIHMDHAGGAGVLLQALPNATVYIHSMTAPHLVEPSRLLKSVERAVGEMWPIYGSIVPIAAERIQPAETLRLDLGHQIVLEAIATPGHSPDHLAFWDAHSRTLWAGDAIGIMMSTHQLAFAVTPPPVFDLPAQLATFERLGHLPIETLLPSHFGRTLNPPATALDEMYTRLTVLCDATLAGMQQTELPLAQIVEQLMPTSRPLHPALDLVVRGTLAMSVRGMKLYFERHPRPV